MKILRIVCSFGLPVEQIEYSIGIVIWVAMKEGSFSINDKFIKRNNPSLTLIARQSHKIVIFLINRYRIEVLIYIFNSIALGLGYHFELIVYV